MATITKITTSKGAVRYRVRVMLGRTPEGKPIQQMRTYRTKKEAETEGARWEADLSRGLAGQSSKMLLSKYLEEWLTRSERRVRPITMAGYRYLIKHCLEGTPLVGLPLSKITRAEVQKWIDATSPAATARKARAVLNIALNDAVRLDLLTTNPVARTQAPAHTPIQGHAWTNAEARAFLAVAADDVYNPFWHLAILLGLRPSEITGLKWESVDLDAKTITVQRARPTAMGKVFPSENTKSAAGRRTVALGLALVTRLRKHHVAQLEARFGQQELCRQRKEEWVLTGLVCSSATGAPLDPRAIQRRFKALVKKAGVPEMRLYDSRHTATSLMLDAGADLKATSENLGHKDPSITMRVYRHVKADQRAHAVNLLAEALGDVEEEAPEDGDEQPLARTS